MKQIKDVEKLKDVFKALHWSYLNNHRVLNWDNIFSTIDSLAVEVPGAKPGAIENALQEYSDALCIDVFTDKQRGQAKKECDEARVELAQLQAEREEANAIIKSLIASIGKDAHQQAIDEARGYLRKAGI